MFHITSFHEDRGGNFQPKSKLKTRKQEDGHLERARCKVKEPRFRYREAVRLAAELALESRSAADRVQNGSLAAKRSNNDGSSNSEG